MTHADTYALIDHYLADRTRRGEIVASSAELASRVLRAWVRHAGPPPWPVAEVEAWIMDDDVRASTRKSRRSQLRGWCRWLVEQEVLEADPTARVGRIVIPDGAPRDLSVSEVARLLAACPDPRARLVVTLMAQMGLRVGDVARIRVEDIDMHRQSLHVRAKGGRGEPTHWEPIPAEAWRALAPALDALPSSGPLVRSHGNHAGRSAVSGKHLGRLLSDWMRAAGLKARAWDGRSSHALRHTAAQHVLDGGADLRDVQHMLGHRTIRSTEKYVRREPPGLRAAMEGRSYRDAA